MSNTNRKEKNLQSKSRPHLNFKQSPLDNLFKLMKIRVKIQRQPSKKNQHQKNGSLKLLLLQLYTSPSEKRKKREEAAKKTAQWQHRQSIESSSPTLRTPMLKNTEGLSWRCFRVRLVFFLSEDFVAVEFAYIFESCLY
jgi:hypothetical protein